MVATRHDMCAVELVEGGGAGGPGHRVDAALPHDDGAPAAEHPHRRPRPRPRRRPASSEAQRRRGSRPRRVAALVAVLLVLSGGELASQARARSSMAALAGVDGVLPPLAGPVTELWRSERALRSELLDVADLLVGVIGQVGRADVVGLDPATGETVWRTRLRPMGPGDSGGGMHCVAPDSTRDLPAGASDRPLVVCVVDRSASDRRAAPPPDASPTDRLVVLDARTGEVLSRRPVERSTTLAALGGDIVTAHADAHGFVHAARTDPWGATVRWRFVAPRPLVVVNPGWATRMKVIGDLVLIDEADGWVLDGDGQVLHAWAGTPAALVEGSTRIIAGRLLTQPHSTGGPYPRTRVTDLVTDAVFTVQGRPLAARPDDGSLGDAVLMRSGGTSGLAAYDATGSPRWAAEGQTEGTALVLDGRVVRVTSRHLTAMDGRTGDTVWQTVLVRPSRTSVVTDGRLVVATQLDGDRGLILGAYGLDDGRQRWTADIPDDIAVLAVFERQLFGWTGEQLVALTPPG